MIIDEFLNVTVFAALVLCIVVLNIRAHKNF
jgi:hypothetical protein